MTIRLLPPLLLCALPLANAQDDAPSAQTLCARHTDALLGALDEAQYDAATTDFDAALRTRYTVARLRLDYEALPVKLGKAMGSGRPHIAETGGHPVVMTPLIFERGTVTAEVHCDADGAISDLRLAVTQSMAAP